MACGSAWKGSASTSSSGACTEDEQTAVKHLVFSSILVGFSLGAAIFLWLKQGNSRALGELK